MLDTHLRNDITTEQQFPGIYNGLDIDSINFIESILLSRYSIGMTTTYEYLKELCNEAREQKFNDSLV